MPGRSTASPGASDCQRASLPSAATRGSPVTGRGDARDPGCSRSAGVGRLRRAHDQASAWSDWDVAVLQFLLAARGFDVGPLDGRFRPANRATRSSPISGQARPRSLGRDRRAGDAGATLSHLRLLSLPCRFHSSRLFSGARDRGRPGPQSTFLPAVVPSEVEALRRAGRASRPQLALALAWVESGYQANVRSSTGDWGPMQISPPAWDFVEGVILGRAVPHRRARNIRVGILYLRHLLREFAGDERLACSPPPPRSGKRPEDGVLPSDGAVRRRDPGKGDGRVADVDEDCGHRPVIVPASPGVPTVRRDRRAASRDRSRRPRSSGLRRLRRPGVVSESRRVEGGTDERRARGPVPRDRVSPTCTSRRSSTSRSPAAWSRSRSSSTSREFRDQGHFCEALAVKIRDDVAEALALPTERVRVTLRQKARGGITVTATS